MQTPKDLMRTTKARFRWNLLNQLLFLAIVAPSIERSNKKYITRERKMNSDWYRQFRAERWVVLGGTLALFVLDWRAALAFLMIPRLFGLWCICGINYVQHDGCDATHPYNHSRNLVGPYINWFLFNNGYHTLHHHKPYLHWSELAEVHEREIAPHNHPALNQQSSLLYVWRAYIWPGRRVRFDGAPVVLGPPVPDEEWLPTSWEMAKEISIGAAGS
jgi:fatty acid desaturase